MVLRFVALVIETVQRLFRASFLILFVFIDESVHDIVSVLGIVLGLIVPIIVLVTVMVGSVVLHISLLFLLLLFLLVFVLVLVLLFLLCMICFLRSVFFFFIFHFSCDCHPVCSLSCFVRDCVLGLFHGMFRVLALETLGILIPCQRVSVHLDSLCVFSFASLIFVCCHCKFVPLSSSFSPSGFLCVLSLLFLLFLLFCSS